MSKSSKNSDPYSKAGVNIDIGNKLISQIKKSVVSSHNANVIDGIGGFAGLYEINQKFKNPVIVACTDGVGTKLNLCLQYQKFNTIGQDLVAMCVNDLVACGAKPLFFLDYYATSKLELHQSSKIIKGVAKACREFSCPLLGGETAEMPGHYKADNFDLAGFSVGIVDKKSIIDGKKIKPNELIVGVCSSGPHSNGYSLIRKLLLKHSPPKNILNALLRPTRIYSLFINECLEDNIPLKGIAHITGGGLTENIPRILPNTVAAQIDTSAWRQPAAFRWIQENGKISDDEMLKIFNCGIGLALIINKKYLSDLNKYVNKHKLKSFVIGKTIRRNSSAINYY